MFVPQSRPQQRRSTAKTLSSPAGFSRVRRWSSRTAPLINQVR